MSLLVFLIFLAIVIMVVAWLAGPSKAKPTVTDTSEPRTNTFIHTNSANNFNNHDNCDFCSFPAEYKFEVQTTKERKLVCAKHYKEYVIRGALGAGYAISLADKSDQILQKEDQTPQDEFWADKVKRLKKAEASQEVITGQGSAGNVIAALCSFIIPGLGQLVQGRLGSAIGHFILAVVLWFILLGWLMHFASALDAAKFKLQS